MAMNKEYDRLVILVPKDLKGNLAVLANRDGRSLSNYIKRILEGHLQSKKPAN